MFSRLSIDSHDASDQTSPLTSSSSTSSLLEGAHLSINTAVEQSEPPNYAISCVNGLSSAGLFEDAAVIAQGYLRQKPNHALFLKHLAKEAMPGLANDEQKKLWTIESLLIACSSTSFFPELPPEPEDLASCLCISGTRHREVGAHEAASACIELALEINHTSAFVISMTTTNLAANVAQSETGEARFTHLQKADDLWELLLQTGPYSDGTFEVPHAEIYQQRAELWKDVKTGLVRSICSILRSNQKTDGINTIAYKELAERVDRLYYEALHSPAYSPTRAPQKAAQLYGWRLDNLAYGDIDPGRQERFLR